jgi:hypothetical protein
MKIDRRVTNGLAWAGVLLVVGIPTADLLSAQFMGEPARASAVQVAPAQVAAVERIAPIPAPLSQRPAAPVARPEIEVAAVTPAKPVVAPVVSAAPAKPVEQVAAVTPAKPVTATPAAPPAADTVGAVNAWLNSGKPLPSYITDESQPAQAVATPARTPIVTTPAAQPAAIDPVQVASIPQPKVAPMPMPLSMRPHPVIATPVAVVGPAGDLVVAPTRPGPRPPANINADELEDWESGPLSEFLEQRQAQAGQDQSDPYYDEGGFFLDEGPNTPRRPRDRLIGPADDFFFPFVN